MKKNSDFFEKIPYLQSFSRVFLEILYKRVFGVAYYEFDDRFSKFQKTDRKYVSFTFFSKFSTYSFYMWYLKVFGFANHKFVVRCLKFKIGDLKWRMTSSQIVHFSKFSFDILYLGIPGLLITNLTSDFIILNG